METAPGPPIRSCVALLYRGPLALRLKMAIAFLSDRWPPVTFHAGDHVEAVEQFHIAPATLPVVRGKRAHFAVTAVHAVVVDRVGRARVPRLRHQAATVIAPQGRLGGP